MKMKTTLAVLCGLAVAVSAFGQGQIVFRNTSASAVINSETGAAVAPGVALAGLYYSTDLAKEPDVTVPNDGFVLASTTAVAPSAAFAGVYSGGTVTISGVAIGTEVVVQVRAWSNQYTSFEAAFNSGTALIGASQRLGPFGLGGGSVPIPNISTVVQGFTITPVPEPSVVVLGLLGGLGAMILLRRKS